MRSRHAAPVDISPPTSSSKSNHEPAANLPASLGGSTGINQEAMPASLDHRTVLAAASTSASGVKPPVMTNAGLPVPAEQRPAPPAAMAASVVKTPPVANADMVIPTQQGVALAAGEKPSEALPDSMPMTDTNIFLPAKPGVLVAVAGQTGGTMPELMQQKLAGAGSHALSSKAAAFLPGPEGVTLDVRMMRAQDFAPFAAGITE